MPSMPVCFYVVEKQAVNSDGCLVFNLHQVANRIILIGYYQNGIVAAKVLLLIRDS